jgi:hypothetical protein
VELIYSMCSIMLKTSNIFKASKSKNLNNYLLSKKQFL